MRFMILRKADKNTEAGVLPDEKLLAAMGKYNEEGVNAGIMRAGEGLQPSSKGARVKFSAGKPAVIDGPFAETKELIAGFGIIEVKSKEEAIEWVKRWPALDGDGEAEIEIRQVFEASDFGPEFTPELREAEERMREHIEKYDRQAASQAKTTIQLNPYLTFNGQCETAFKFYEQCLSGKIVAMLKNGETPMAEQVSSEWRNKIIHARLIVGDKVLMGSDMSPDCYEQPKGLSVSLGIDNPAEAERIFHALAENGTVRMPIQQTFWAIRFGMLVDRFGIPWMINCEQAAA